MPDYSFVVSPSFNPFSMQEMLVPFSAYKDAFEKSEEQYDTLTQGADKFKYLSETLPEGSKARQIYEGYANDLRTQAEDLAHNGLTMGNKRALTSLKRRYQGEMGRILQADEAMREEKKLRQSLGTQDTSLLYANDNLNIDDFLDGNTPNLYRISGNELYTRGAAAGKAASSRIFSAGDAGSTLNGYYRDYVQKMGYSPETIRKFYEDMSTIPELQRAADAILEERGVNENLSGYNLRRARQSVINGMIDGAVYQENHSPQRDLGVMDAATSEQLKLSAASQGMEKVNGRWQYNPIIDPQYQKAMVIAQLKQDAKGSKKSGNNTGSSGSENASQYQSLLEKGIRIKWNGDEILKGIIDDPDDISIHNIDDTDYKSERVGKPVSYEELPDYIQTKIDNIIGSNVDEDNYVFYYKPYKSGGLFNDTEAEVEIIPKKVIKGNELKQLDFGAI